MLAVRRLGVLLYRSVKGFFEDGCSHRAAAISYYVLFSLFPLVIFTVGILGLVLQDDQLRADVLEEIMDNLPLSQDEGRDDVSTALEDVASTRAGAIGVVGLLALGWSASSMFGVIRSSLNHVLRVTTPRPVVLQKLIDLGTVLAFAPFFIGSVVATSALRLARTASEDVRFLGDLPQNMGPAWWIASAILPLAISFIAFFLLYWLVPARQTAARYVVPSAVLAAIMFEAVTVGFSIYIENFSSYDLVFGSLGAVVAFLFWVYLSASILLLGAEIIAELPAVLAGRYDEKSSTGPGETTRVKVLRFLRGLILRPKNGTQAENPGDGPPPSSRPG